MVVRIVSATLLVLVCASAALAGVYALTSDGTLPTFAIAHPPGFDGSGGVLTIGVCTLDPSLDIPIQNAMATWNALTAITGNCTRCMRVEDLPMEQPFGQQIQSVILHELGHTLGLDHTNLNLAGTESSATNGFDTASVDLGADGIAGSSDDRHLPQPPNPDPARIIHWFRQVDNNPLVVDGLVIDDNTFTRTRVLLPSGHTWPASANSDYRMPADDVADLLGFPNTQAVMYSFQSEELVYSGLAADDVNTIAMGMAGFDKLASTPDDYTFQFVLEPNCSLADIQVEFVDPFIDPDLLPGRLGVTVVSLEGIPEPPSMTQHFVVEPALGELRIRLKLNDNITWDIRGGIFADGLETGDFSQWDEVIP